MRLYTNGCGIINKLIGGLPTKWGESELHTSHLQASKLMHMSGADVDHILNGRPVCSTYWVCMRHSRFGVAVLT